MPIKEKVQLSNESNVNGGRFIFPVISGVKCHVVYI